MRLLRVPVLPLCVAVVAIGMVAPAAHAAIEHDWRSARAFFYCSIAVGFAAAVLGVALSSGDRRVNARAELRDLIACWLLVPVFAAAPVWLRTPFLGIWGAWFEMISAFTTTGGTAYAEPENVPGAIHLWRGMVAWLGGLVTLTAAFAILAPRNLGGYELVAAAGARDQASAASAAQGAGLPPLETRTGRSLRTVLPVYGALTGALAILFSVTGQGGLAASVHAMAIVSTSGVSPYSGGIASGGSIAAELVAAVFMVACATRLTYGAAHALDPGRWYRDPELRLMALLVGLSTLALFLRHWVGALTIDEAAEGSEALTAIWGAVFTCLSFLTTTGFESASWHSARDWSGLANPGLILLGLCAIGGGAATTAGGFKLLRGHTLLRHGYRELERIAQPNSVLASGSRLRGVLRESAFLAWAFVMLYSMAIFVAVIALTITGLAFEDALVAAISAISNTGPAFALVTPGDIDFARLGESQRVILALTMVLGRIETLAAISLFNPNGWSRFSIRTKKTGNVRFESPDS